MLEENAVKIICGCVDIWSSVGLALCFVGGNVGDLVCVRYALYIRGWVTSAGKEEDRVDSSLATRCEDGKIKARPSNLTMELASEQYG